MMGSQPSKARWARDESPLPRADDEANAFEDANMYRRFEHSDEPNPSPSMPDGLPSMSLKATPTSNIYPNGLLRHPPHPTPAVYTSERDESPVPLKGEPEEHLGPPSRGAFRTKALGSLNLRAKQAPPFREEEGNDEIVYEQPSASLTRRKKTEKKKKAERRNKRKHTEKLARSAGDNDNDDDDDDDEQLPTPDITDSLVSADDDDAEHRGEKESSTLDYVVSDLLLPTRESESKHKRKGKKSKTKEKAAMLDLEDDPIAESQEIDVPASFQPTRKRKERDDQGDFGGLKTRKKRKVHAPAELVEDFDEGHKAESAGDEVVENTQENTTPRPLRLNAEVEKIPLHGLAVASQGSPLLREPNPHRLELNQVDDEASDWEDQGSAESPLQRGEEDSDGDLAKNEPNPFQLSSSSSESSRSVVHRITLPRSDSADHFSQRDSGPGDGGEPEAHSRREAGDGLAQSAVPKQDKYELEEEEAAGHDRVGQEDPESPEAGLFAEDDDQFDEAELDTSQSIPLFAGQEAPGRTGGAAEGGGISDGQVSSMRKAHALQKASPARRKLPLVRTLARRPKPPNARPGMSEDAEDEGAVFTDEPSGIDHNGNHQLADFLQAVAAPTTTSSPSRPKLSKASFRRRPKVPYFERDGQERARALATIDTGEAALAPIGPQPGTTRDNLNDAPGAPRPARSTRKAATLPETPQQRAATSSRRPPSVSENAASSRSHAGDRVPATVAKEEGPAHQGAEPGTQPSPPIQRTGPLTQQEEDWIMEAVRVFQAERGVTMDEMVELIQANPKQGLPIHQQLWRNIEKACPTRKRQKLIDWCRKKYHSFVARGVWSQQEDEELRRMVEQHGTKWTTIAKEINRHPNDVRDRYRNYVSCGPNQNKDYWQEDEEERLRDVVLQCLQAIDAVRKRGCDIEDERSNEECLDWTIVSEKMDRTRSRRQCLQKWKQLRSADDIGRCSGVLSPGASWRLGRARQQLGTLTPHDKFLLVRGIRTSGVTKDEKIVWKDVTSGLFDKQYPNATLAVFWARLKRTVPGWEAKSTAACAEYLCKKYGAQGKIDVDPGDSEADERDEERIIASLTPGAAASPWAGRMAPPSSIRSADRDKIHRTPREFLYSDSPQALVGTAPIGRTPRVRAHHVTVSGTGPSRDRASELGSQLSTPASPAEPTAMGARKSATVRRSPLGTPSKAAPSKHPRTTVGELRSTEKGLSVARIAPGESDSDEVGESPPRPTSRLRSEASGENGSQRRSYALVGHEDAGRRDDDLRGESPRARRAPSEGAESIDLGTDLGQPSDSRDHSVGGDSTLLSAPAGRLNPKAAAEGQRTKPPRTMPARTSTGAQSGQKRQRLDEQSDGDLGRVRTKRLRRGIRPAPAVVEEQTDESDKGGDDKGSQSEAESRGDGAVEEGPGSVRGVDGRNATGSEKSDATSDATSDDDASDDNDSDRGSKGSAVSDAMDANEAGNLSGVNWGSPIQAAIASSIQNDLGLDIEDDSSSSSDNESESNMDDMEDIPARPLRTTPAWGGNPFIDDEVSEEADETGDDDSDDEESSGSEETEEDEFDSFEDETLPATNLQSDSDDEDYVDS